MNDAQTFEPRRLLWLVLGLVTLCTACAPYRWEKEQAQQDTRSIIEAPRSQRGNPPFYEVFGERYYVLESSSGYNERGVASWYGRDFHGQPTSGGEPYDMYGMTAAHKTLPIPTWVEVTNLRNARRVIVRVNDRGPFIDNRIIDLSYRAAQDLDIVRDGTALVQVRALGAPASRDALPDTRQAGNSGATRGLGIISDAVADVPLPGDRPFQQLYVQVGAFAEHDNAAKLAARLKRHGFGNSFIVSGMPGQDRLHRVRIGPLASADQFDRINDGLRDLGLDAGRLVTEN